MKANKTPLFPSIRRRLQAATPGRWIANVVDDFCHNVTDKEGFFLAENLFSGDCALIANAPTDLAKLLSCLDEAVEALTYYEKNCPIEAENKSSVILNEHRAYSTKAREVLARLSAESEAE